MIDTNFVLILSKWSCFHQSRNHFFDDVKRWWARFKLKIALNTMINVSKILCFSNDRIKLSKAFIVTSSHVRNVTLHQEIVQKNSSRPLLVCCRFARHDGKFVTRLSSVTRIVWLTELDDNSTASFFLSNSSLYMRRDSSREIWAESGAIDRDVRRLRLADV
jgi:hypothetical protein